MSSGWIVVYPAWSQWLTEFIQEGITRHYVNVTGRGLGLVLFVFVINRQRQVLRPPSFYLLAKPCLHRRARVCVGARACVWVRALACTGCFLYSAVKQFNRYGEWSKGERRRNRVWIPDRDKRFVASTPLLPKFILWRHSFLQMSSELLLLEQIVP